MIFLIEISERKNIPSSLKSCCCDTNQHEIYGFIGQTLWQCICLKWSLLRFEYWPPDYNADGGILQMVDNPE